MKQFVRECLYALVTLVVIVLTTTQLQWSDELPGIHWIIVSVGFLALVRFERAVVLLLVAGTLLELQSGMPFGMTFIPLTLSFACTRYLFLRLFNRTALHTVIFKTVVWTCLNSIFLAVAIALVQAVGTFSYSDASISEVFRAMLLQVFVHGAFATAGYYLYNFASNSFIRTDKVSTRYA